MHGVEVNSKVWGRDASLLAQSMERTASSPLWNPRLPFSPLVVAATASVALQATSPPGSLAAWRRAWGWMPEFGLPMKSWNRLSNSDRLIKLLSLFNKPLDRERVVV